MNELIDYLRLCDKGIDSWQDTKLYVAGERERQLSWFHAQRSIALSDIRELIAGGSDDKDTG